MADGTGKWSLWDFSSLDDWEVEHCWSYEFTRLVPGLVRRVADWRKTLPKRESQDLFEAYRFKQGGRATPFIQIGNNLFLIPLGVYYLFPEWPSTAYLEIPSGVRSLRLQKLSDAEETRIEFPTGKEIFVWKVGRPESREIDPNPAEYGLDPVSGRSPQWNDDAWKRLTENLKKSVLDSNTLRVFRSDSAVLALLRIDWTRSDKQLLALFSKFLASNRPTRFQKQGTLGRSHPLSKKRTELGYLRKYLIVQETGTWKTKVNGVPLFRDRSRWNDCRKAVKRILADLGSYPGCTM